MTNITDKEKGVLTDLSNMKSINREQKEVIKGILDKFYVNGTCELYVDGAADLHSKSAGIGGVIFKDSQELITFSKPLYDKTNNESEYLALLEGLNVSLELNIMNINKLGATIYREINNKKDVIHLIETIISTAQNKNLREEMKMKSIRIFDGKELKRVVDKIKKIF